MGFVSMLEDASERYYEGFETYTGTAPTQRVTREADDLFGRPYEKVRRSIRRFYAYYRDESQVVSGHRKTWEAHLASLEKLDSILSRVQTVREQADESSWNKLKAVKAEIRTFFESTGDSRPLTPKTIKELEVRTRLIIARSQEIQRDVEQFLMHAERLRAQPQEREQIRLDLERFQSIQTQFGRDMRALARCERLQSDVLDQWRLFVDLYNTLPARIGYRPLLCELDRFLLHPDQEELVSRDYDKWFRVQGVSGSGKTIILAHRAIRLAEDDNAVVRVLTLNRSLSEMLQAALVAISGKPLPPNLHVAAIYDFFLECIAVVEPIDGLRLVDELSSERVPVSWLDFCRHAGLQPEQNVFALRDVRQLLESIERQGGFGRDAAFAYLREEVVYVQTAWPRQSREQYRYDPRVGRSLRFNQRRRAAVLAVLDAWEEYLQFGDLCDTHGVTSRAADVIFDDARLQRVREQCPTHHILVDEVQDLSTLELAMLNRLIGTPDGPNAFFFAGDMQQRSQPKHHFSIHAGFDLRGRAALLTKNFRNTREILEAAYRIPERYPPESERILELKQPEYSVYGGKRPLIVDCTRLNQAALVLEIIRHRQNARVAVVGENRHLLKRIIDAAQAHVQVRELISNDDLDRWRPHEDVLGTTLTVARLEAVKGYEFDTVIAVDFSQGVVPPAGVPTEEFWRPAAVTYAALTRARNELIITFSGEPSPFIDAISYYADCHEATDPKHIQSLLGIW